MNTALLQVPEITRFVVRVTLDDRCTLPAFAGSQLRGILGQGLALIGLAELDEAEDGRDVPSPVLVVPPLSDDGDPDAIITHEAGAELEFEVVGFGPQIAVLSSVADALAEVGKRNFLGIQGGPRTSFRSRIVAVLGPSEDGSDPNEWYRPWELSLVPAIETRIDYLSNFDAFELQFRTPVALRLGKGMVSDFSQPAKVFESLAARASLLAANFGAAAEVYAPNLEGVSMTIDRSLPITLLRLRGKIIQPMHALTGSAQILLEDPSLTVWLALAEQIGVGRWSKYGLGQVVAEGVFVEL